MISFDANAIGPLSLFLAKSDIRSYLHGLFVTPAPSGSGCILAATNGHQIALWHDKSGECSNNTIIRVEKLMIQACNERSDGPRSVKLADGRLSLVDSAGDDIFIQAVDAEIKADYPSIWRVIPANENLTPGLHGCTSARYLHAIGKAGKIIQRQSGRDVALSHYTVGTDGQGCVLTRFEGAEHFIVVTMPLVSRSLYPDKSPRPARFAPPAPPAVDAADSANN